MIIYEDLEPKLFVITWLGTIKTKLKDLTLNSNHILQKIKNKHKKTTKQNCIWERSHFLDLWCYPPLSNKLVWQTWLLSWSVMMNKTVRQFYEKLWLFLDLLGIILDLQFDLFTSSYDTTVHYIWCRYRIGKATYSINIIMCVIICVCVWVWVYVCHIPFVEEAAVYTSKNVLKV